jgi:hypothetical protein
MKHLYLRRLCALATLLACFNSYAASAQPAMALQQIRLDLSGSLGDFYLLYGVDSDPAHLASVQQRIIQTDQLLRQLDAPTDGGGLDTLLRLREQWSAYRGLLQELARNLQQQRSPSGGSIAELIQLNRLLTRLSDTLEVYYQRPDPLTTQCRVLAMQLQTLTTDYLAHSVGANALGGDKPALDVQSKVFSEGLQQLLKTSTSGETQALLNSIQRRWRYIEPSLQHYQQDNVPTLVSRYSRRIIDDLQQLPKLSKTAP